jgi:hypothetical protein
MKVRPYNPDVEFMSRTETFKDAVKRLILIQRCSRIKRT